MAFREPFEPPAVHKENVEPVVLVVVKEGGAAAGGFEKILVAVFAAENHLNVQAGLFGDVDELDAKRRACDRRWRAFRRGSCGGFIRLTGTAFGRLWGLPAESRSRQRQDVFER